MEDYVRGYKYRIYPTQEQEAKFNQMFGNARVVFNYFLGVRQTCCRGSFLCVMWLFPCLLLAKKETPKGVSWGGADSINLLECMSSPRRTNTFREFY